MQKILRIFGVVLAVVILLPLLISMLLSPPGGGRAAAEAQGIPYPAVVAHRGASWYAPEETAPAYLLAREIGADYLELDLQRTRDGVLIAFHDDTLERTTNVAEVFPGREKQSIDRFAWYELQRLDAGSWFNAAHPERARESFAGAKIMRLDEIIDIAEGGEHKPGIYIETKSPELFPGIEADLVEALAKRGWFAPRNAGRARGSVILQTFSKKSLAELKRVAPDVPRVYLIDQEMAAEEGFENLLDQAAELGHGAGPVGYLGFPWHTGAVHRRGLVVHHYTINTTMQMRLLNFFGSDGFFTDRPDLLLLFYGRAESIDLEQLFSKIGY